MRNRGVRPNVKKQAQSVFSRLTAPLGRLRYKGVACVLVVAVGHMYWQVWPNLKIDRSGRVMSKIALWQRADGARVVLAPMVHFATPRFYEEVAEMGGGGVTLMEGIRPRQHTQESSSFRLLRWMLHTLAQVLFTTFGFVSISLIRALSMQTQPETAAYLVSQDYFDAFVPWFSYCENADLPLSTISACPSSLITRRNNNLLVNLDTKLSHPFAWNYVIIPWGGAHTQGISEGLLNRGFIMVESQYIEVMSLPELFRTWIPYI
eukprot:TRINITY_DN2374_c0_g2_i4.p1 TRINITY_DN2374_c0_g2~~TRINITY_DN2374_c0_g2_i4.p1  ORF type:complete len:280 (+),score=21.00 TRINITY_DN2374_c0_g2_i4:53-841(+)